MFMGLQSFLDCRLFFNFLLFDTPGLLSICRIFIRVLYGFSCLILARVILQIDAAINSGNSGGPAFNDKGKCVGIAFQSLKYEDVENIGYVIPTPVIMHFIQDYVKNGTYTGIRSQDLVS